VGGLTAGLVGLMVGPWLLRGLLVHLRRALWVILGGAMLALWPLAGGLALLVDILGRLLCFAPLAATWRTDTAASAVCLASNRGRKHQKRSARGRKWACFRVI